MVSSSRKNGVKQIRVLKPEYDKLAAAADVAEDIADYDPDCTAGHELRQLLSRIDRETGRYTMAEPGGKESDE